MAELVILAFLENCVGTLNIRNLMRVVKLSIEILRI